MRCVDISGDDAEAGSRKKKEEARDSRALVRRFLVEAMLFFFLLLRLSLCETLASCLVLSASVSRHTYQQAFPPTRTV